MLHTLVNSGNVDCKIIDTEDGCSQLGGMRHDLSTEIGRRGGNIVKQVLDGFLRAVELECPTSGLSLLAHQVQWLAISRQHELPSRVDVRFLGRTPPSGANSYLNRPLNQLIRENDSFSGDSGVRKIAPDSASPLSKLATCSSKPFCERW